MNVDFSEEPEICCHKNLSTEESLKSKPLTPMNTAKPELFQDQSLRLFTFMNLKSGKQPKEESKLKRKKSVKHCKKSIKRLSQPNTSKATNSGLIEMIEESRKKRQHFLKLLSENQCISSIQNPRKCKTPTNQKSITPVANTRKSQTPRNSLGHNPCEKKLFRARSSLGSIANKNLNERSECNLNGRKNEKSRTRVEKNREKEQKEWKEEKVLVRRKQELERQLLAINESLLLKKNKGRKMRNKR